MDTCFSHINCLSIEISKFPRIIIVPFGFTISKASKRGLLSFTLQAIITESNPLVTEELTKDLNFSSSLKELIFKLFNSLALKILGS